MTEDGYIQVTHRELPYTTFDADNHLYENGDALTKFLPREYEGLIRYVDINGRTKLAIRDRIEPEVLDTDAEEADEDAEAIADSDALTAADSERLPKD